MAPVFLNPQQHVQQCTFAFIGLENERVSVNFEDFDLKGKTEKKEAAPRLRPPFSQKKSCGGTNRKDLELVAREIIVAVNFRRMTTTTREILIIRTSYYMRRRSGASNMESLKMGPLLETVTKSKQQECN